MNALTRRLARLEQRHRAAYAAPERVFSCIVRKGSEEADQAEAFDRLGISPTAADLVILSVIVDPAGGPMADIKPSASVLSALSR